MIEGFRLAVLARLRALRGGRLRITDGGRSWDFGPVDAARRGELVVVTRHRWRPAAWMAKLPQPVPISRTS